MLLYVITIILSLVNNLCVIFMNDRFGYHKLKYDRKVKVRNALKILILLSSFIPLVNIVVSLWVLIYSADNYTYDIDDLIEDEENKIIKWLFK